MIPTRIVLALTVAGVLAGCSSLNSLSNRARVDYSQAAQAERALELPPELSEPRYDNRYALPEKAKSAVYSHYAGNRQQAAEAPIAPNVSGNVRVERSGSDRWLVAKASPEQLWPRIKQFLVAQGFPVTQESPATGVLTTSWTEKRIEAPRSMLQDLFHRGLGQKVASDEMNRFRVRLERLGEGGETEIYVTHQGRQEVARNSDGTSLIWTPTPSDPIREAELMVRLMTFLGAPENQARQQVVASVAPATGSELRQVDGVSAITLAEPFDRAWRRVGLALDRVGFTMEDRDRSRGTFVVRMSNEQIKGRDGGLGKLAFWRDNETQVTTERLHVVVAPAGDSTRVTVQDPTGRQATSEPGGRILRLLAAELM